MSVIKKKDILFNILTSVPRVPFCKSGQKIIIIRQTIPPEKPPDVGGAAFTQLGPSLSPLRSPSGGVFSPPEFILWHYKDVCGAADNGDDIFFSPSQWSPSLLLWAKAQFASNSGPGFFFLFFFSHPCQTGGPALWRNESPGCLKAQPVSGLEGLAIHSLRIVLQATMGCMGAWPFVIGSVVNSCWGNKSVTHLWLWIRSSLFFFLLSSRSSPPRHCPWQRWPHQKSSSDRNRPSWSTPLNKGRQDSWVYFSFFPWWQFLSVRRSPVITCEHNFDSAAALIQPVHLAFHGDFLWVFIKVKKHQSCFDIPASPLTPPRVFCQGSGGHIQATKSKIGPIFKESLDSPWPHRKSKWFRARYAERDVLKELWGLDGSNSLWDAVAFLVCHLRETLDLLQV